MLVWGLDAMAITFVAPHSLHARPMVVPRSRDVEVTNETVDVPVAVIVDGHQVGRARGGRFDARTAGRAAKPARVVAGIDLLQSLPRYVRVLTPA